MNPQLFWLSIDCFESFFKAEHFHSKLHIFGLRTFEDVILCFWETVIFHHFQIIIEQTTNRLIKKIIYRWSNNETVNWSPNSEFLETALTTSANILYEGNPALTVNNRLLLLISKSSWYSAVSPQHLDSPPVCGCRWIFMSSEELIHPVFTCL